VDEELKKLRLYLFGGGRITVCESEHVDLEVTYVGSYHIDRVERLGDGVTLTTSLRCNDFDTFAKEVHRRVRFAEWRQIVDAAKGVQL